MIYSDLSEEELCLFALFMDETGLDQAEFCMIDERNKETGLFRAWPVQQFWWRKKSKKIISQGSRSIGKSLSAKLRAFAFPFVHPGGELVITAPEGLHLDALTDNIESLFLRNKIAESMLAKDQRGRIKHRPFHVNFANSGRIMARLPKFDGSGVRGCFEAGTLVLTRRGHVPIEKVMVGDYVFTHNHNWKRVSHTWRFWEENPQHLKALRLAEGITCSPIQKFWARFGNPVSMNNNQPEWCQVTDLDKARHRRYRWHLQSPIDFPSDMQPDFNFEYGGNLINLYYFFGLYQAEGSLSVKSGKRVYLSIHEDEVNHIKAVVEELGYYAGVSSKKGKGAEVSFSPKTLVDFIRKHFGTVKNKRIPSWLYGAAPELRNAFLHGALYGDGYLNSYGQWEYVTVVRSLAYDMKVLGQSLGFTCAVSRNNTETSFSKNGWYKVTISNLPETSNIVENNILAGVRSVEPTGEPIYVYDLTVEDDHSFMANSVFVNNTHPDWLIQDESCFPGETLVLTYEGYKKIKEVKIGDLVLTHKGNWKKVLNVIDNGLREVIELKGQGHYGLRVTPNHRFWGQEVLDYKDRKNKWGIKKKSDFKWIRAEDMVNNLWSTPTVVPYFDIPKNIQASNISTSYDIDILSDDFLWCLGLYIAEGSVSSSYGTGGKLNKTTWSVHSKEVEFVTSKLAGAGINWFVQPVKASDNCKNIVVTHIDLARFMKENCGTSCYEKTIPLWIHALTPYQRQMVYDGLIYGDGCDVNDDRYREGNQALSTTSKKLAFDFQLLARSISRTASLTYDSGNKVGNIRGREFISGPSYDIRSRLQGQGIIVEDKVLHKVKSCKDAGIERVYDLTVEDDHSFIVEGIIVHNSFYPEPAWKELIETLIINDDEENDNSRWFSHGVTVGPGNTFDDKISGKDSTWEVVPLPAMYRPNWTEKERQDKIIEYGGEDSPDYRRNVKGLSANAGTPLLVMYRLMEAVDTDEYSSYNLEEYYNTAINDAQVREVDDILDLFDPPISHTKYGKVWIGMDYGLTTSNSCIVIYAETKEKGEDHGRLKLLSKVILTRIPTEDQVKLIKHIMSIYRPMAFVFDAHGIGQPAYDWLQKEVREDPEIEWMLDRIKGYSFSKKMIVQFDPNIEINENDPEGWKEAAIERLGAEASIDSLRLMVDSQRLRLPYDKELINELQAVQRKEPVRYDEYGKPKRKQGQHTLDAIRFALLGYNQHPIEEIINSYEGNYQAPEMIIMDYI